MPNVYESEIRKNTEIADNIYALTFACGEIAEQAKAGQFVHIKCGRSRLLRRPISICSVSGDEVKIVFETVGSGTRWLSERRALDKLDVLGPLGHGFTFPDGDIIVVGGGIGTPPMLYAAQSAKGDVTAILGFQTENKLILKNEFEQICKQVIITTDDGSAGEQGFVTAPLEKLLIGSILGGYASVMSCGPLPMQKAVAELCKRHNVPCQVSLEERMGCGVGACLVCACETERGGVREMSRVCADGPVFDGEEVIL